MAQALRAISIKRGADPREHVLVSFGGAGGLHVCALAALLDAQAAIVPVHGGVLSALGMLAARPGRQLSRTRIAPLDAAPEAELEAIFAELESQGLAALRDEGFEAAACDASWSADLRYAGQSYTLDLPWQGLAETGESFHQRHLERYGHRLDLPVELVNQRVQVRGPASRLRLPELAPGGPAAPTGYVALHDIDAPVPRYRRERLVAGQRIAGPALVLERVSTTWIEPGWILEVDSVGNLLLSR